MNDFLVGHALKNVWCSPRQDLQVRFQPQRISPVRGIRTKVPLYWGAVNLPTTTDVYHVYHLGQRAAHLLGLNPQRRVWRTVASLMNELSLMANIYTADGLQFHRSQAWMMVTEDETILLAMREQPKIADLRTTEVFLRLYSNSFFSSQRSDNYPHRIHCEGQRVVSPMQALNVQREFLNYKALPVGHAWLLVNGVYKDDYPPSAYRSGDLVEFVYDSTVKSVREFAVKDLDTFNSERDQRRKYLLHYSGPQVGGQIIDYRDDIDVYLLKQTGARWEGIYFHTNSDDALRQVTHRDYSIPVDFVVAHQQARSNWITVDDLKVRVFIRHAGYARPLVFEHQRIQELYKLPDEDVRRAMLGIDSTVENWRAPALENSDYVRLMDSYSAQVTNDRVRDAYGYNAIAKLIGETPQRVETYSGRRAVRLPYGLQVDSTIFELNAGGKLLGSYIHTLGEEYTPFHGTCRMIEGIVGRGGQRVDIEYGRNGVPIDPRLSYRYYVAPIAQGQVNNARWEDVTGDETKYLIIDGKVQWLVDLQYNAVAVKSDALFLNYELEMAPDNGLLRFSVNATSKHNGVDASGLMHIPPGRLDVWLNDEVLIEGLDYFVKWPQIVVTNKSFRAAGQNQKLRVRGTGFCNSDMSRLAPKEVGFVQWGRLSRNNRYDLRDDRVVRVVINGRTYHRDVLKFAEDDGLSVSGVPNGSPYILEDLVVPLRRVVDEKTYRLRERSLEVDAAVSAYLTSRLPEPTPPNPDQINERYAVFSPFASTILYDLITERLSIDRFKGQYSDQDVRVYLEEYAYLLDFDPCKSETLDLAHVAIHPHDRDVVLEVNIYQYNLLRRAIKVFLNDKVDLSRFVRVKDSYL